MQTKSMLTASTRALLIVAALLLVAPAAQAQAMADGRGLIQAATRAIEGVESMTARMTLTGGGSKSFLKFMPSGEGVFRAKRVENESGELVWATRIIGVGKDRGDGEEYSFDAATHGESVTWVEHRSKSVNTNTRARARGAGLSMRQQLNLDELLVGEPYARELDGVSFEIKDRELIGGVECDVVVVTYPKDESASAARSGKALPNMATWHIGVNDQLPRRIERTNDAEIVKISLILTLEDLRVGAEIPAEELEVSVPEGYRKIEPRAAGGPARPTIKAGSVRRGENVQSASRAAPRPKAPSFSVPDSSGATVSNETQAGRVSVIYFWGTWCVPCRNYSPLVSGLAEVFSGEGVDILAPAIRSDAGRAEAYITGNNYRQRLLVEADDMAKAFRVRVYPTIYVLDEMGGIVATESPTKGESAQELIKRVESLVRDELTRISADG